MTTRPDYDDRTTDVLAGISGPVERVVVVGAGIAGLTVASALTHAGVDAVVLEARDRIGGRLHTVDLAGAPIDLGGSWIHHPVGNPLRAFADQVGVPCAGADPIPEIGGFDCAEGRRLSADEVAASLRLVYEEFAEATDRLRAQLGPEASAAEAIEVFLAETGLGPADHRRARQNLRAIIEAEAAGTAESQSLQWMWNETEYEGSYFGDVPVGGYGGWSTRWPPASTSGSASRSPRWPSRRAGSRCAATTAPSRRARTSWSPCRSECCRRGSPRFSPPLPPDRLAAIARLGFGRYEKVVLRFEEPFWRAAGLPHVMLFPADPDDRHHVGLRAGRVRRRPVLVLHDLRECGRPGRRLDPGRCGGLGAGDARGRRRAARARRRPRSRSRPGPPTRTAGARTPTSRPVRTRTTWICSASQWAAACCSRGSTPRAPGWRTPTAR